MKENKHMRRNKGIQLNYIQKSSPFYKSGLRKHAVILSVNGQSIENDLDFSYYSACEYCDIIALQNGLKQSFFVEREPGELPGIDFVPQPSKQCRNRCIFCFIDQLPKGLRKSLYIKDEDYRYSFLNGNYITLTSLTKEDIGKICELQLSPIYISVHSTDPTIRTKMLNNKKAGQILIQLKELAQGHISFHTQIVVCPGINDGPGLKNTLHDLLFFSEELLSVAVVPVGLTKYSNPALAPVTKKNAENICSLVRNINEEDMRNRNERRIFIADEFYIKAGIPIPDQSYYGEYPQIENGVGLIRLLFEEWESIKRQLSENIVSSAEKSTNSEHRGKKNILLLTSFSAKSYLSEIINEFCRIYFPFTIRVVSVKNTFFGESVTVAGLLTGTDLLKTIKKTRIKWDVVFIPKIIFNYNNYTLDGFSLNRITKYAGCSVKVITDLTQLVNICKKYIHGN